MIRQLTSSAIRSYGGAVERLAIGLGATPVIVLTIARFALVLVAVTEFHTVGLRDGGLANVVQLVDGLLLAWSLAGLAVHFAPPRMEFAIRPYFLTLDLVLLLTLVALFQPLELPAICCILILFWVTYERLGRRITLPFCLALVLTLMLRGTYEPWGAILMMPGGSALADFTTIFIGGLIALAAIGANLRMARLKAWGDQLEAAGSTLQNLPIAFFLQQVMGISRSAYGAVLWEEAGSDDLKGLACHGEKLLTMTAPARQALPLPDSPVSDAAFLFSRVSPDVLMRGHGGTLRLTSAQKLIPAIAGAFDMGQGYSFPVNAGEIRGRIFVAARHGWLPSMVDEVTAMEDSADAFFQRYFFLRAWRARAFVDARYALSRDLHDSVLQTLAALRVRIAILVKALGRDASPAQLDELTSLQQMLTAEQSHLRTLLNESDRHVGAKDSLSETLDRCTALVTQQWSIQCQARPSSPDVQIARATAIEVEFLIREVVANAVQHAQASHISVSAAQQGDELLLVFRDEADKGRRWSGGSNEEGNDMVQSRSIIRRLAALGGRAYADTLSRSTLLSIRIPLRPATVVD